MAKDARGSWDRALLDSLFGEPTDDCLRMLLIRDMALIADENGRAPIATLAQRFRNFFRKRSQEGKREERAEILASDQPLSGQSLDWWQRIVTERSTANASDFVIQDRDYLVFRSELWSRWTPGFRRALRNIAEARLLEYFDTRVEGGW
jgi:hypothetical protein